MEAHPFTYRILDIPKVGIEQPNEMLHENQYLADAIAPSNSEFITQSDWQQWIEVNILDFKGDIEKAAVLMAAYSEGNQYLYQKFARFNNKMLAPFQRIDTYILLNESVAELDIGTILEEEQGKFKPKISYVKLSFLEYYSKQDFKKEIFFTGFRGYLPDYFGIAGVEEAHHSIFSQFKNNIISLDPTMFSEIEYSANEIEYRALKWQLRYAQEKKFPQTTIKKLEDLLLSVQALRN